MDARGNIVDIDDERAEAAPIASAQGPDSMAQ
jgi:hypothetical protein